MLNTIKRLFGWPVPETTADDPDSGSRAIVILIDGTLSKLDEGCETNVGLTKKLLDALPSSQVKVFYEPGIQWTDWRSGIDVLTGNGIDRQICKAYGALASWYRPGDQIYLMGFSRGAYAVRSLAGVIERVGLLHREKATQALVQRAWRYYVSNPDGAGPFRQAHCHREVNVTALGVWDTVKALGLRLPVLWRLTEHRHAFHNHRLASSTLAGFQALALDETRVAYEPVMWAGREDWNGTLEQVWFEGTHGEIGGHLYGLHDQRSLSNIPLVWLLGRMEDKGLPLPTGWRDRFRFDPDQPSKGQIGAWSWLFMARRARSWLRFPSEDLDPSVRPDHPARKNR